MTENPGTSEVIINNGGLPLIDTLIIVAKVIADGEAGRDVGVIVNRDGGTLTLNDVVIRDAYLKGSVALRAQSEGYAGGHAALFFNRATCW